MFTGIVEETGSVDRIKSGVRSIELTVRVRRCGRGVKIGDSIAVNGCCLTVVGRRAIGSGHLLQFDLLRETWDRTNFKALKSSSLVNVERSLPVNGRVDGHFVTGHIDGVGTIQRWEPSGKDRVLEVAAAPEVMRYVIFKGSIAVDGISLTVAEVRRKSFVIWIIPHTYEVTALQERKVSDEVNLETDVLGKYVAKFVGA